MFFRGFRWFFEVVLEFLVLFIGRGGLYEVFYGVGFRSFRIV